MVISIFTLACLFPPSDYFTCTYKKSEINILDQTLKIYLQLIQEEIRKQIPLPFLHT